MNLSNDLLRILRCPLCKGELRPEQTLDDLTAFDCQPCKLRFRVKDGIPNFLVDEAVPLEEP